MREAEGLRGIIRGKERDGQKGGDRQSRAFDGDESCADSLSNLENRYS